jgi:hypothetical protein
MLAAVYLHNQFEFKAKKIRKIRTKRRLPAESDAQIGIAQPFPDYLFRLGLITTQFSGT